MEAEKIEEQRRLYGEPIGTLVRRVTAGLDLNQARVAQILGLSPPMLSQLVSGHRVKIGNPLALARLQRLLVLVEDAPALPVDAVQRRLEEIRTHHSTLSTSQFVHVTEPTEIIRRALRAVASGQELDRAAEALADVAPGLAELVRVYGTGSEADAARHFAAISHVV
ncbi:DNA-binding protein [Nocardioides ochotonae]|uniref:DNA-binding protein n=1 Tax=Nocardioides ochotonae TaxID=2685869 RepID=UPI00140937B4|nr:DNA-binding protein [Nocardioides ochotonae]